MKSVTSLSPAEKYELIRNSLGNKTQEYPYRTD